MIAVGFALLVFSGLMGLILKPDPFRWDWRDWFCTAPSFLGCGAVFAGVVIWLWRVAP